VTSKTGKSLQARPKQPVERMTTAVRTAVLAMVHDGLCRGDAAAKAGLSEHGLYQALRRPLVRRLYNSELEVVRSSGRARTLHRLEELRDQDENRNAAVKACQVLEQLADLPQNTNSRGQLSPGLIIQIVNGPMPRPVPIDVTPREPAAEPLPPFKGRPAD
jgi:hypothetical protein